MKGTNSQLKWLISMMCIIIVFLIMAVSYLTVTNYKKEFVPRDDVKKDTIQKVTIENGIEELDKEKADLSILFDYYGGFELDLKHKKANIYVDYYEKGELKKHERVIEMLGKKERFNGQLVWGIASDSNVLSVGTISNDGGSMASIDAFWLKNDANWVSGTSAAYGKRDIEVGSKYLLYKWVENENSEMSAYIDDSEEFSKERIAENDKLVQLYIEFE